MSQFKVGDWCLDTRDNNIKQVLNPESPVVCAYYELWKPKQGEWCWFFYEEDTHGVIGRYGYPHHEYSGDYQDNCDNYEPFIGELPSFLKGRHEIE